MLRRSGLRYEEIVFAVFDAAPDVVAGVHDIFAGAAEVLRQTDYVDACPIATVALEVASSNEPLRQATADVFESWVRAASHRFAAAGVTGPESRVLAHVIIELLEGAFILSRAARSTEALKAAGSAAEALVRAAVGPPPRGRK